MCGACVLGLAGGKGKTPGNSVPLWGDLCIPHRLKINHVQLRLKGSTELIQKGHADAMHVATHAQYFGKTKRAAEITPCQLATGSTQTHTSLQPT